jgi:uncharacterized protein (DUF302 family)
MEISTMTEAHDQPVGTVAVPGLTHRPSKDSVPETVDRLRRLIDGAGATVFAVVDQSGAAATVGLTLRPTVLIVFGNPAAGTPVMQKSPLSALDLPLKILVWEDDAGQVWMTSLSAQWLADRYGLPADLTKPLAAPDALIEQVASG